jgi:hypothetical protein
MIRTIKGWLGVSIVLLLVAMPAQAGDWQEHGFFFVQSKLTSDNKTACEIELSLNVKQQLFALVWVEIEDGNSPLIVNYMSGDPRIALAKRVVVTIDGAEILAFSPNSRLSEPEITTLSGLVPGEAAARSWEALQHAAEKATWLTVAAGDTLARVPANGLRETLADFAECRRQRSV